MTQDERWEVRYQEVRTFIESNKRNPSKHIDEERGQYLNWIKQNRQRMNAEEFKGESGGTQKVPVFNEIV